MVEFAHESVLVREVLEVLAPKPGAMIIDGTLGGGGHAALLLDRGASVIGLDRDPTALAAANARLSAYGDRFVPIQANFRDVGAVLKRFGLETADGLLVDLGVSSPQFDDPARGFSFRAAGPLDMRMGPDAGSLADFLDRVDERELSRVIHEYGEERFARPIAARIKEQLAEIGDTASLAKIIEQAIPRKFWPPKIHPATRTFQALRIAVNDELGALAAWLDAVPGLLAPGGRAAAISFHSLEDRAVKRAFEELTRACRCPPELPVCVCGGPKFRAVSRKAIVPSDEEVERNPRARSAKLRAVESLSKNHLDRLGTMEPEGRSHTKMADFRATARDRKSTRPPAGAAHGQALERP